MKQKGIASYFGGNNSTETAPHKVAVAETKERKSSKRKQTDAEVPDEALKTAPVPARKRLNKKKAEAQPVTAKDLEDSDLQDSEADNAALPLKENNATNAAASPAAAEAKSSPVRRARSRSASPADSGTKKTRRKSKSPSIDNTEAEAGADAKETAASPKRRSSKQAAAADGSAQPQEQGSPDKDAPSKRSKGNWLTNAAAAKEPLGKAAKVDGVGPGAIAAAAHHGNFDAKELACWEEAKPVPYSFLASTFEAIAEESKRLIIINILVNCFRTIIALTPNDLLPAVYLCANKIAAAHEGLEMGVGDALLIKALATATGKNEQSIKKEYEETGDLGTVACNARSKQRTMFQPQPLTVMGVFRTFKQLAALQGSGSQEKKRDLISKMIVAAKQSEAGYIARSLQGSRTGRLRIGLAEKSMLVALAHAVALEELKGKKESVQSIANRLEFAASQVKQAFSECPSYDKLVPALLQHGIDNLLDHCHFMPGVPISPMLAKATNGVSEVLDRFSGLDFTCEYKYDGERAQVHVLENGEVRVYSRNMENNTSKFPDVVGRLHSHLKPGVKSIVLDGELVAWDAKAGHVLPFQILSTRARKDVKMADIKVQVCLFAFDCLYLNGKVLLREPLTDRRNALYESLTEQPGELHFAEFKVSKDVEELQRFLEEAVEARTEGLIVKTMNDTYEPSRRSSHWLKLKKDYLESGGDTFDVVPIGGFYGKGKRTGMYGSFLLAVYNPDNEEFQTISKIGTGFSEEVLKSLSDELKQHVIPTPRRYYSYSTEAFVPDVWFDASMVWEVKAADLSISPVYFAGRGLADETKGISIRFPRLVRVRDDKKPEDATTAEQIAEMYGAQAAVKQRTKKSGVASDDEE